MNLSKTLSGHIQIEIVDNCDFDKFYSIAELIKQNLGITFANKIHDFDSIYWDFEFDNQLYTLDYNVFLGVGLTVIKAKLSTAEEYKALNAILEFLKKFILQ